MHPSTWLALVIMVNPAGQLNVVPPPPPPLSVTQLVPLQLS